MKVESCEFYGKLVLFYCIYLSIYAHIYNVQYNFKILFCFLGRT